MQGDAYGYREEMLWTTPGLLCLHDASHGRIHNAGGGVLRLARRIWNDVRAVADRPDPGEDNK